MIQRLSEPFTYANGSLAGNGGWSAFIGSAPPVASNLVNFDDSGRGAARAVTGAFDPAMPWRLECQVKHAVVSDDVTQLNLILGDLATATIACLLTFEAGAGGSNTLSWVQVTLTRTGETTPDVNEFSGPQTFTAGAFQDVVLGYDGDRRLYVTLNGTRILRTPPVAMPADLTKQVAFYGGPSAADDTLQIDNLSLYVVTPDQAGDVSADPDEPTEIGLPVKTNTAGLTVTGSGKFRYAVNGEAVDEETNSCLPANGDLVILQHRTNIDRVTLYANNGETNQTYTLASISRR